MSYRIPDEPRPGALARVAVNPVWPLFALMVGGTWLSWTWFVVNGFALGSPNRFRELFLAIAGLFGSGALLLGLSVLLDQGFLPQGSAPYLLTILLVWKIGISYMLHIWQGRSFSLFEYYGGQVDGRLPFVVLALGWYLRPLLLGDLPIFFQGLLA